MTQLTAKPFTARPLAARPFTAYPFGESTSVSNPLVWLAAYPDAYGVMQAQVRGEGTPSFTVDDGLLLPDHEGIYRATAEDTPPWHGARKVENLLASSETLSTQNVTVVSGADYVLSFEGTGTVTLSNATSDSLAGTAGQRKALEVFTAGSTTLTVTVSGTITRAQLENVTAQTIQAPSEYVPTTTAAASTYLSYSNGNTVASNVVTEAKGATLDPLPSLYGAPSYTNSLTYSNDLTNAAWSLAGTSVASLDANGLTGAPNTATTLTDDNASANEYMTQTVAITSSSNTHTARLFVKKDSDETRFPCLRLACYTGGTQIDAYVYFNTATGAVDTTGSHGSTVAEVNDAGDWWEVLGSLTDNNTGNTLFLVRVQPAACTTIGTPVSSATGSCIAGNVEAHTTKTIAQVRGSAPIVTAASTVTTTAITDVHDSGNWVDTSGGLYCEVTLQVAQNIVSTFLDVSGSTFRLNDGTNTATSAWVTNTAYQLGIAWDASAGTMAINVDGTWSSNATYDGTLLAGALDIFRSPAGVGLMRNLKRYKASNLAAAKALVDGDMP